MDKNLENELVSVANMTFEELCFLFPMPEEELDMPPAPFDTFSLVQFKGPFNGALQLGVASELLPILAENILGEEDIQDQQKQDALGEVTNVICGNLLPKIAGKKPVFYLETPKISNTQTDKKDICCDLVADVVLTFMEGRAGIKLYLKDYKDHLVI